jgi:hypothetical protein
MTHQDDGDTVITEREAFIAMRLFLEQFYARAGNDMETLIADITLESDGKSLDPAAWDDWLRCINDAKK